MRQDASSEQDFNEAPRGYGYRVDSYGYGGYSAADAGSGVSRRHIQDYLLIIREKIWYFVLTFLVIVLGACIYIFKATPVYRATSTVQLLREDVKVLGVQSIDASSEIRNSEDLNTQLRILESAAIMNSVAARLSERQLQALLAPYQKKQGEMGALLFAQEVLGENRTIQPDRLSLIVQISYDHPNPAVAAQIANLFASEYINYNLRLNIETSMRAVDDLKLRTAQQQARVEELDLELAHYRERFETVSLEARADIDHQELSEINQVLTEDRKRFDIAKNSWELVQDYQSQSRDLTELTSINRDPLVADLISRRAAQRIELSSLGKRYRASHPTMQQAQREMDQINSELETAVQSAVQKIYSNFVDAKNNLDSSQARLRQKEKAIFELNKVRVGYDSIARNLSVDQKLYEAMVSRLNTEMAQVNLKSPNARIVDEAVPPQSPAKPKKLLIFVASIIGGGGVGIAVVMFIAFIDDRVKSVFDIEAVLGLPLLGIVPRIDKLDSVEKAASVASQSNSKILESFRSIHSALKLNELSDKAKVVLVTSTVPSEGKSFCSLSLAQTFSAHGEKTLIIDADLRMPSVAKTLQLKHTGGIIPHCQESMSLDDAIAHEVFPDLDVLSSGGRSDRSTQLFSQTVFAQMIKDLRERYDRIIIDCPPLGAVSDVLNLIPLADGLVYVVKYNAVKRKTARGNVRRLLNSNLPVFGSILNQVDRSVASYYYTNYSDYAYRKYYAVQSETAGRS